MIRMSSSYSPNEVLPLVADGPEKWTGDNKRAILPDGNSFKRLSQRLITFKTKGCQCVSCVSCGLVGEIFYFEKCTPNERPHLNLYGRRDGKEVLITKDHIIPKSRGGEDYLTNYQTMCINCNRAKGNKI